MFDEPEFGDLAILSLELYRIQSFNYKRLLMMTFDNIFTKNDVSEPGSFYLLPCSRDQVRLLFYSTIHIQIMPTGNT
jgi:hypothetical protein